MSNYAGLGGGGGGGGGGEEVQVYKQRVQLADLPAATTTGVVAWTTAVPTGSLVIGGALGINADVDLGASGITVLECALLAGQTNVFLTLDVAGALGTGSPRVLTRENSTGDFPDTAYAKGPVVQTGPLEGVFYQITATGGNLDQLAAFDVTFILLTTTTLITLP